MLPLNLLGINPARMAAFTAKRKKTIQKQKNRTIFGKPGLL